MSAMKATRAKGSKATRADQQQSVTLVEKPGGLQMVVTLNQLDRLGDAVDALCAFRDLLDDDNFGMLKLIDDHIQTVKDISDQLTETFQEAREAKNQ
jgi:hypothetical protein